MATGRASSDCILLSLKTNKILGIVSFTIFNSIASSYILKEVDLDIKNKTENN